MDEPPAVVLAPIGPPQIPNGHLPNGPVENGDALFHGVEDIFAMLEGAANPRPRLLICVCGTTHAQQVPQMVDIFYDSFDLKIAATKCALNMFNRLAVRNNVPVYTDDDEGSTWAVEKRNLHKELADWAQYIMVMPASSNTLSKIALGFCDNLVTNIVRCSRVPVCVVPDMDPVMFMKNVTTQRLGELRNQEHFFVLDPPTFNGPDQVPVCGYMPSFEAVLDWLNGLLAGDDAQLPGP